MSSHKVQIALLSRNQLGGSKGTRAAAWCTCGANTPQMSEAMCKQWANEHVQESSNDR